MLETDEENILVYRIRISMPAGRILEMRERIVSSKRDETLDTTAYSFHWQDQDITLLEKNIISRKGAKVSSFVRILFKFPGMPFNKIY